MSTKAQRMLLLSSGYLFTIAVEAVKDVKRLPLDEGPAAHRYITAIVFAALSLEAFINELVQAAEIAGKRVELSDELPPTVAAVGKILPGVEQNRGQIELKLQLLSTLLSGQPYAKGDTVFQNFDILVSLRNALAHYKSLDTVVYDPSAGLLYLETKNEGILKRLRGGSWISSESGNPFMAQIATLTVAQRSCNAASELVKSLVDKLPESEFKNAIVNSARPFTELTWDLPSS